MVVEGLEDEDFKAVRVAAGDSVSLALSDNGELRCWGSFRVSRRLVGQSSRHADDIRNHSTAKVYSVSTLMTSLLCINSSLSRSRTSPRTRLYKSRLETTTLSRCRLKAKSLLAGTASNASSVAKSFNVSR